MDSYIVRIYRKGQDSPEEIAGLVEMVGSSERMAFKSFPELTSVLHSMLDDGSGSGRIKMQQAAAGGKAELNLVAGRER